jgi:hypothetical protein
MYCRFPNARVPTRNPNPRVAIPNDLAKPLQGSPLTVGNAEPLRIGLVLIGVIGKPTGFPLAIVSVSLNVPIAFVLSPAMQGHFNTPELVGLRKCKAELFQLADKSVQSLSL